MKNNIPIVAIALTVIAVTVAITSQSASAVPVAKLDAVSSVPAVPEEQPQAWFLDLRTGPQVKVYLRKPAAANESPLVAISGMPDPQYILTGVSLPDGTYFPWASKERPQSFWDEVLSTIEGEFSKTSPVPSASAQRERIETRRGALGTSVIYLPSKSCKDAGQITSVLYGLYPNKVTAVGAFVGNGMVLIDELNDKKGVRVISTIPLAGGTPFALLAGPQCVVLPRDPEAFAKNVGKLLINPEQQAKVALLLVSNILPKPGQPIPGLPIPIPLPKNPTTDDPLGVPGRLAKHPERALPWNW